MRVAIYLRQSQDRDGDELGVTRQREDVEQLVRARGGTVVHIYIDNGVSAAGRKARPQFAAMLAAIEAGEIDVVAAWSLDRLTRNNRDTLALLEAGERRKITIVLVRGSDIDLGTPSGQFSATLFAGVARHEIQVKSDRQRRAQQQAAEQGRRVGGRKPFGYERDGKTVIPAEAEAIRRAYNDLLAGVPLGAIAREWNSQGLLSGQTGWKTGQPSEWAYDTVRLVLLNPRNAGLRRYKGEIVGPAEWPAIVPETVWRAADALLREPSRRTGGPGREGRRLLTGVALCGVCDATVHAGRGYGNRRNYYMYRCSGSLGHISRRGDVIDEFVSAVTVARLCRPDAIDLLVDQDRPDVDELRSQAAALRSRLDTVAAEFANDDTVTPKQLRTITRNLLDQLAEVETAMADAGRVDVLGPLVRAPDVGAVWAGLSVDRKRRVIDVLMRVTILPVGRGVRTFRPESVDIEWKQ